MRADPIPIIRKAEAEMASRVGARMTRVMDEVAARDLVEQIDLGATELRPVRRLCILEAPDLRVFDLRRIGREARERGRRVAREERRLGVDPAQFNEVVVAEISRATCAGSAACRLGAHVAVEHLDIVCEEAGVRGLVAVSVSRDIDRTAPLARELLEEAEPPSAEEAKAVRAGLATLDERLREHNSAALAVASYLACHPRVRRVRYPGLPDHPDRELAATQLTGGAGPWVTFWLEHGRKLKDEASLDAVRLGRSGYLLYCGSDALATCAEIERQIP